MGSSKTVCQQAIRLLKLNDKNERSPQFLKLTKRNGKKCVDHVKKVEIEMCRLDGIRDVSKQIEIDLRSSESGMSDTDSNFESSSQESESISCSET